MSEPWIVKHRPHTLAEVVGNVESVGKVSEWLKSWGKKKAGKKALLLHGPPGVGKTVTAEALAAGEKYELVEVNASDNRKREAVDRIIGRASSQSGLFGKKRVILIDEVDGIDPTEDRGALDAIVHIINHTTCPIIMTANDPWNPKLSELRSVATMVEFKRLGSREVASYIQKVASIEGLEVEDKALRTIIDRNKGDMRSTLNDLQVLGSGRRKLTEDDIGPLTWRDRKENIFTLLAAIFHARNIQSAKRALDSADINFEMVFEWIYENVSRQLPDPSDLSAAMDALAKADVYMARIKKRQTWALLPFFLELMSGGVAAAKNLSKPGWVSMRFPDRIRLLARTRKLRMIRRKIGGQIAAKTHMSAPTALKNFEAYLRFIFENNDEMAADLSEWFGFDDETVNYLSEGTVKKA